MRTRVEAERRRASCSQESQRGEARSPSSVAALAIVAAGVILANATS